MMKLEFNILVTSIPLASLYLSTILITDLLFIVSLSSCYISEILGGLFQLTLFSQSLEIFLLILGSLTTPSVEQYYILLSLIPIVTYSNADTKKSQILLDNKDMTGIYLWTHIKSGKIYVGSSSNLKTRLSQYFNINYLERNKRMNICNALKEHGYSSFSLSILEYINITDFCLSEARVLIFEREQYYLDLIFSQDEPNTYNTLKRAGSLLGFTHSSETKALMSKALSGKNHPRSFLDKTDSAETLAKMSTSLTEKLATQPTKAKSSEANSGKILTEDTKLKISEALIGKVLTKATKAKISKANLGKTKSEGIK